MEETNGDPTVRAPWNKGKIVGQKTPFKLKEISAIRVRLQLAERRRELALFISNRQQTAGLRSGQIAGARRLQRKHRGAAGDRYATENSEARAIRNYRTDARSGQGVGVSGTSSP
jgi:hypothetical protein